MSFDIWDMDIELLLGYFFDWHLDNFVTQSWQPCPGCRRGENL